jgi:arginase
MRRLALIGVPFNSAGKTAGVARAPSTLRAAGLGDAVAQVAEVRDAGDVDVGTPQPERSSASGLLAEDSLVTMIANVRSAVNAVFNSNEFPLVVGGDCPVMLGCLAAGRDRDGSCGLLMMDGHEDGYPPKLSPTGEAADSELFIALGLDTAGLPDELRRLLPLVDATQVTLLGPRDEATIVSEGAWSLRGTVNLYSDDELRSSGPGAAAEEAARGLSHTADAWWLHTDLDVLATDQLSSVDYPQPGGLSWEDLADMTTQALATPGCAGWTVAIYNPDLDSGCTDAGRIVDYVASSLAHLPDAG